MAAVYEYVPINRHKNRENAHDHAHTELRRKIASLQETQAVMKKNASKNRVRSINGGLVGEMTLPLNEVYAPGIADAPRKQTKTVVREKAKMQPGVASTLLLIAVVFVMLALVLMGYAKISAATLENAAISARIEELAQQSEQLQLDIALGQDLNSIQQRASELNMASPTAEQIVYLPADKVTQSTEDPGVVQEVQSESENQGEGFSFAKLFDKIKQWLE